MFRFLKQLWFSETNGLGKAALLVSVASLLSRLVGVLRDRVLASTFGAGMQLDAYYAAFRLPDIIYNLLILGALTAGFIPIFTEYWEKRSHEEALRLSEQVLSLIGFALIVAGIGLYLSAPMLVPKAVSGFSEEGIRLTITLTRIMCLSPLLLGLSAVMGGVLQSTRRLFAFALAPILYNVGIIVGALVLSSRWGIAGVAWGVVIGAALHLIVQFSVAHHIGLRRLHFPSFKPEGVRRILALMVPRTAGLAVSQINVLILLSLASGLSAGSVSVFTLANNLQSFPIGIIGVSFAIAAFPILSSAIARKNDQEFSRVFSQTVSRIVFFMLPIMAAFLLFDEQIVRLVLGQGRFDWDDTSRTTLVLSWFSLSLLAQALIPLFARGFYAIQNTWTPLWIALIAEVMNLALALTLRGTLGIAGLAASFSLASILQLSLLWIVLRRQRALGGRTILLTFAKTIIATLIFALVVQVLREWGPRFSSDYYGQSFSLLLQIVILGTAGLVAFVGTASLLRLREWQEIQSKLFTKLSVRKR